MSDGSNVFISWSGKRSREAARALYEWLPIVLQSVRPWMSETDIDKGSRGLDELGKALEGMKVGIICLTPENLNAEWILFEAGALSKTLDAKTRVCTYLLAGLLPQNIKQPLGMFQWTKAEKEDTRKLVHAINRALDVAPVPDPNLDAAFNALWPSLDEKLSTLPVPDGVVQEQRTLPEMVAEVLELSRQAANSRKSVESLDSFVPIFEMLLPYVPVFSEAIKTIPRPEALLLSMNKDPNPSSSLPAAVPQPKS
jgi:TIR domain